MAEEKSREVSDFVKLISERKYYDAAKVYEELVEGVTCSYSNSLLTEEREHQLQLKPTKAYKRLKRFFNNQDAVCGVLDLLVIPDFGSSILRATNKIVPAKRFSKQIASCDVAIHRFCLLGSMMHAFAATRLSDGPCFESEQIGLYEYYIYVCTLKYIVEASPDFVESAVDAGLFSMLMANYPYPCKPPRNRERAELFRKIGLYTAGCFHSFLNTPEKRERVLRSDRAPVLTPYVTRFLTMVTGIVKQFPDLAFEVQAVTLLDTIDLFLNQAKGIVPGILSGEKFDALIRAIKELRPHFGNSVVRIADSLLTSARTKGDVDAAAAAAAVFSSQLATRMTPESAARRLVPDSDKSKIDRQLEKRVTELVSEFTKQVRGLKPGAKKGAQMLVQQKLQRLLTDLLTELEEGVLRGQISHEVTDAVGSEILQVLPVALPVLPVAAHPYVFALVVFCYNYGTESVAKWQEYTRVMVGVNLTGVDMRHANLAWPFTALLFGALDVELSVSRRIRGALAFLASFKVSLGKASGFLGASAVQGLVKRCWAVIDEADTGPFD